MESSKDDKAKPLQVFNIDQKSSIRKHGRESQLLAESRHIRTVTKFSHSDIQCCLL